MVSAELLKCAQEGKITLNKWDGQTFSTVTVNCFTIHHQSLRDHFNRHFEAQQFKNPYYPNNNAVQNKGGCNGGSYLIGCTELAAPNNSTLTVESYFKDEDNNQQSIGPDTITY